MLMNRSSQPHRHAWQRFIGSMLALCVSASIALAQAHEQDHLMPPGYSLPVQPSPIPDPARYETKDRVRLSFHGHDLLVHRMPLDTTPLNWADDLLTLIVGLPGENQGWLPSNRYQVHPVGPPGHSHDPRAMALLGDELVIFLAPLRGQPPQPYPSANQSGYTIALVGHEIVVTKEHHRRWYFQTRDFGATWHLARMELLNRPNQSITLSYSGNRLASLDLPNGRKFELTYTQDRVTAIRDPFGSETQIKYDPQGMISQIDQYTSDAPDGRARFRTASYSYTYDDRQRLATFLDDRRMQWSCAYQLEEPTGQRSPITHMYTTRVTNLEGDYLFQRTEVRRDGHHARITGSGDRRTSIEAAIAQYQFAQQVVLPWGVNAPGSRGAPRNTPAGQASIVETRTFNTGMAPWLNDGWPRSLDDYRYTMHYLPWSRESDRSPKADSNMNIRSRWEHDAAGRVIVAHHILTGNDKGQPLASPSSSSAKSPAAQKPLATFRYTYSPQGNLLEAVLEGDKSKQPHRFVTDTWGRIIRHQQPDEAYTSWVYDDLGRLAEQQVGTPLAKDPKDLFAETRFQVTSTRFTYDQFARLLRRGTEGQPEERFVYNASGQLTSHQSGGPATQLRYRHDRLGSIIQLDRATGDKQEYAYFTDGRLARHDVRPKNDRWVIREFNPQGLLVAEQIENLGRTQYEYDEQGRQAKITHPNGQTTLYTYDDLNRIITIRGNAQPPADIRYDSDGQRIVTTPR